MLVNDGHLLIDSVVSNVCGSTEVTYIEKKKKVKTYCSCTKKLFLRLFLLPSFRFF